MAASRGATKRDGTGAGVAGATSSGVDDAVTQSSGQPNLECPRIRAAMKVLGVTADDLSVSSTPRVGSGKARPGGGSDKAPSPRRLDVLERKRQELIATVEKTADALEADVAETVLSPDPVSEAREAGRALGMKLDKADEKIASLKKKTQREIKRMADDEQMRLQRLDDAAAKEKEVQKRIDEQRAETKARMEEKQRRMMEMANKREESRMKQRREINENKKAQMQRLNDSFQKVEQVQLERSLNVEETLRNRVTNEDFMLQRALDAAELRMEAYRTVAEKEGRTARRLDELRTQGRSKVAEEQAKHAVRMQSLNEELDRQQKEREENFRKREEKLATARAEAQKVQAEMAAEMAAARQKRMEKKEQLLEACRRRRWERKNDIKAKLAQKDCQGKEKFLEEELSRRADQRDVMQELVVQNQQRNQRAADFAKDQMLSKIMQNSARVEGIKEQREKVAQNRTLILKDALIKKDQMQDMIDQAKAAIGRANSPTKEGDAK